ncbi:AraC family transcriptional regulator [Spirosoma sp. KNUC1025]|uniref:helix-turn-helix domain-containing protein n=1 Tax=Spirosoma sp. KNUC1025 TaxID=2894082 RepID=UPI0038641FC3|nr:AraC family transcriptional regulator [Spirosoma sp. KNUC1025]
MQTLPVHLDLFALIMLLGVAQGLFLGVFFLTGERSRNVANRCLGFFMLGISTIITEILLCYTNYMFQVLWLIDFSEPANFTVGPLYFFYVFARIHRRLPRGWRWHLVPFGIWLLNSITWFYQPIEHKYNAYIHAYHPELSYVRSLDYMPTDFTHLRDYVSEITLLSCLIYGIWACVVVWKAYRRAGDTFVGKSSVQLNQLRNLTLLNISLSWLIIIIKPQFYEDLGDYILACYITGIIYITSYLVMRGSNFYRDEILPEPLVVDPETLGEPKKKYEKSALSEELEDAVLTKLTQLLKTEKPYLDSDLSLPKLANRLSTSPHHLSQLLNDRLGQNFFDWLATHRIAEAKFLLCDPATAYLKIDEIAERVGYNSTSAFHTAFKRLTNQTPAQYRAKGMGQGA